MSSVDWNAVKQTAKAGGTVPEGTYNLILENAVGYESGKGAPGIKFRFKVEDGEYKGAVFTHQPTIQLEYPGLTASFLRDLAAVGVPDGFLVGEKQMDEVAAFIMQQPRRVRADLIVDEYNNTKSNKLKKYTNLMPAVGSSNGAFTIAPPPMAQAPATTASAPASSFIAPPAEPKMPPF